jgi:hypothetical protein
MPDNKKCGLSYTFSQAFHNKLDSQNNCMLSMLLTITKVQVSDTTKIP